MTVPEPNHELLRENERLQQQVLQLQKELARSQEVAIISMHVVDTRITCREGRATIEYELQIETDTRGTLVVWHRYSTFRNLSETLQTKNGYDRKQIPELSDKQVPSSVSDKFVRERAAKLNQFLEAIVKAEYLQFGIRVDEHTNVFKRRVKSPPSRERIASTATTVSCSSDDHSPRAE